MTVKDLLPESAGNTEESESILVIGLVEESAMATPEEWRFASGAPSFWRSILGSASRRRKVLAPSVNWNNILFARFDDQVAGYLQFYRHGKGPHAPSYADINREFGARSAWWRYLLYQLFHLRFCQFEAYIYRLIVKEEFRGQGVGRQLVDSWLDMLKAQGVRKAYLEVWSDNQSAIGFYKALGFKVKPGLSYLPFKCCNKPYPITMVYQCQ